MAPCLTQSISTRYAQDHQRLDELFHRFEELKETDFRKANRLFGEFKAGLERHIVWEEGILFPLLDEKTGHLTDSWTAVMRWEHRHLRNYLVRVEQNLAGVDIDAELERIAFASLLCSHNQKEERIVYPMMDQMVSGQERRGIFSRMQQTPYGASFAETWNSAGGFVIQWSWRLRALCETSGGAFVHCILASEAGRSLDFSQSDALYVGVLTAA